MILLPGAGVAGNLPVIPAEKTATRESGRMKRVILNHCYCCLTENDVFRQAAGGDGYPHPPQHN